MTPEQERALAIARARIRLQQQSTAPAGQAAPAAASAAPVDMRRSAQPFTPTPGVIGHRDWWDQNAQRLGLPANPTSLDEITQARQQNDPEGFAAFNASQQGQQFNAAPTTEAWTPEAQAQNIPVTGPGQFGRALFQGATLGWGDEISGLLGGNVDAERQLLQGYRDASPGNAQTAEMLGALGTAVLPAGWAARGASTAGKVFRGVLSGAAGGAVQGAGATNADGYGPEAWRQRAEGAVRAGVPASVLGGLIPIAAPLVARGASRLIPDSWTREAPLPTSADLRASSQADFRAANDAGLTVPQGELVDFYTNVRRKADDLGADLDVSPADSNTPMTTRLLNRIDKATAPVLPGVLRSYDLAELSRIREAASGAARNFQNPHDQTIALMVRDEFDDWLDNLTPGQVLSGDPQAASAALASARESWRRMRRTEVLEDLQNTARLRAASSPRSEEQILRDLTRQLAENPRALRGFTAEERAVIEEVATGGNVRRALEMYARFAPGGFFSTALGVLGASTGNVPLMGLTLSGMLARGGVNRSINRSFGNLNELVRTGQQASAGGVLPPSVLGALQAGNMTETPRIAPGLLPASFGLPRNFLPVR